MDRREIILERDGAGLALSARCEMGKQRKGEGKGREEKREGEGERGRGRVKWGREGN